MSSTAARKVAHVTAGLYGVLALFILNQSMYILQAGLFAVIFAVGQYYSIFSGIHHSKRFSIGEIMFAVGLLIVGSTLFTHKSIGVLMILIVTVADTLAELCGIAEKRKSLPGSTAFFVSTVIISALWVIVVGKTVSVHVIGFIAGLSTVLTVTEAVSLYGTDNATVPLVGVLMFMVFFI
jgi:dolichol kinase